MEFLESSKITRIAVLSDIHAYSSEKLKVLGGAAPSYVDTSAPSDLPGINPFVGLSRLIDENKLSVDLLVCGGDLGDRASPEAITYAWEQVRLISTRLGARKLFVTSGNHDLDSRFAHNDHDARSVLQGLVEYPFPEPEFNNEYWARNLVVQVVDGVRYVVLNSSAHHGFADDYEHGRISSRTLQYLKDKLDATPGTETNVLILHHHLQKSTSVDPDDESEMKHGAVLLDVLDSGDYGRWLVLHGHRHFPSITYGPGSTDSAVIFSAGSFGAVPWDETAAKARNQFYILELHQSSSGKVKGTFQAWDFIASEGFQPAQSRSGLPHRGGFGSAAGASAIALEIYRILGSRELLTWEEAIAQEPDLRFAAPRDLASARKILLDRYGVNMVYSEEGVPLQVGKPA